MSWWTFSNNIILVQFTNNIKFTKEKFLLSFFFHSFPNAIYLKRTFFSIYSLRPFLSLPGAHIVSLFFSFLLHFFLLFVLVPFFVHFTFRVNWCLHSMCIHSSRMNWTEIKKRNEKKIWSWSWSENGTCAREQPMKEKYLTKKWNMVKIDEVK